MNVRYELTITGICPVNPDVRDFYHCTVQATETIEVEKILAAAKLYEDAQNFQEQITQALADELQATVTTVGYHSGVKTTCTAS